MGPIGVALNGVVFFNPFEQGGMNAVEGYSEVWLDSCCGHPEQTGMYHYHKYPACVKSPFPDDGRQHSPAIGFAFDGYPIRGPYEADGLMAKDIEGALAGPRAAADGRGRSVPAEKPSWVQVGPYEAVAVERQGNVVKATLDIPADATLGVLLDCHLEFGDGAGPGRRVLKKNDALRVTE
jgi:hypothetical protein